MSIRWILFACLIACGCSPGGETGSGSSPAVTAQVQATAAEHSGDVPDSTPITEVAPASEVIAQEVPYGEWDNRLLSGYFVLPADADEPLPGIVMIHEWWGLNDNIRAMARRLAGEGYAVLAVDLYQGQTADTPQAAERLMSGALINRDLTLDNLRQAHAYLGEFALAPRVATLGWCLGGGLSLEAAIELGEEVDAVVMFYGQIVGDDERLSGLDAPLLGMFAELDESIPVSLVRQFRSRLRDLDKRAEVVIFPDVDHAFANPSGTAYNHAAALEAWSMALDFLDTELR